MHVLKAPKPGGLYDLKPVLSNGLVTGRETVSSMQRRLSSRATLAGINGDLFNWGSGRPSGIFLRRNLLSTRALPNRSSLGIGVDGLLRTGFIRYTGTWQFGSNKLRTLREFNHPLEQDSGVVLYSPTWGPRTPRVRGAREIVLSHVAPVGPNKDLVGRVVLRSWSTHHQIPAGGAVLQASGDLRKILLEEAKLGHWVKLHVSLTPWWSDVKDAIGGGPRLVTGGVPVFQAGEAFLSSQLLPRNPRTAIGQLANGRILMVAVDGRVSWSAGVTNSQLARLMADLGAQTAMGLDAGGSTTMAFDGQVLNHPSDGGERAVADSLMVFYYGIYARKPRLPLYSPNGDGVADLQRLYAKVVRRSQVSLRLVRASDGHVAWSSTGTRRPRHRRQEPHPEPRRRQVALGRVGDGHQGTHERDEPHVRHELHAWLPQALAQHPAPDASRGQPRHLLPPGARGGRQGDDPDGLGPGRPPSALRPPRHGPALHGLEREERQRQGRA